MKRNLPILALVALLYLPALGSSSSGTHPDEMYYLGISAEMDARGAWLTPTLDGEPKWFKPPLFYWAERAAYAALGRGFLGGRLPAALAAMALALVTGALARRMYGERAGTLAALLVATTLGWLRYGRLAMMDAPMALAFAAAAWGTWRACEDDRPAQLLWAGVGAGVGFMLKGPVAAVIVLLFAGGYVALRRPALLRTRFTAGAFVLGAAIGLPWYVASFAAHGRRFYDFFVVEQNLDRFRHPWTIAGEGTLLGGYVALLLPWTPLAVAGVPPPRRWREPGVLLPLLWIGAVLAVFSIPALKWPHYGLGCAPAAALLASREPAPRWARMATAAALGVAGALALAALRWPLPPAAAASLAGAAVALGIACFLVARARVAAGAVATGAAAALVLAVATPAVNPPVIPAAPLAALDGRDLHVYDYVPGTFTLGAGRPVRRVERRELAATFDRGGVVIASATSLAGLRPGEAGPLAAVTSWRHMRGYIPVADVVQSWRARDLSALFEPMIALERAEEPSAAAR